jgi:hypothetical protein
MHTHIHAGCQAHKVIFDIPPSDSNIPLLLRSVTNTAHTTKHQGIQVLMGLADTSHVLSAHASP